MSIAILSVHMIFEEAGVSHGDAKEDPQERFNGEIFLICSYW